MKFKDSDWELIIAAYAYEIMHEPIMSDNTFDILCMSMMNSQIPDFDKSTGQWVHSVLKIVDKSLIESFVHNAQTMRIGSSVRFWVPQEYSLTVRD